MKTNDKSTKINAAVLSGTPTLDLYLKEIDWKLRSMMAQADVLDTALQEIVKQHPEYAPAAPVLAERVGEMIAATKP